MEIHTPFHMINEHTYLAKCSIGHEMDALCLTIYKGDFLCEDSWDSLNIYDSSMLIFDKIHVIDY